MSIKNFIRNKWWQKNVVTTIKGEKIDFSLGAYKQTEKENIMEKITDGMLISEDVINKAPIVTIIGNNNISIENYKGIVEYTDEKVVVQTKKKKIMIQGSRIKISYYYDCEMRIIGNIESITYY